MKKLAALSLSSLALATSAVAPWPEPLGPVYPQGKTDQSAQVVKLRRLAAKRLKLLGRRERQLSVAHSNLRRRWNPTVEYAIELASRVFGVPAWQIRRVGTCESHLNVFARNGRYLGFMQLGWSPFGFSPFDPIASALSAAATVRQDGSWRQWQCKPG